MTPAGGAQLSRRNQRPSLCGQPGAALLQLRTAIQENYFSYPAMEKDPLFDPIRLNRFSRLEDVCSSNQCAKATALLVPAWSD